MVLVSDKPSNAIGILQTQLRDREGHEARRVGLEAVPLAPHIEGRHGAREARVAIRPAPMHPLLPMADEWQPGEHGLDEHAVLPRPALTPWQVAGIARRGMEAGLTQANPLLLHLPHQPLK